jgi:subtilisin family serine protease
MNSKLTGSCLMASLFCACSMLFPGFNPGSESIPGGRIADVAVDNLESSLAVVPSIAEDFQWDLRKVRAPEAWDIIPGGQDVVVAVLDTGIDGSHAELVGKVLNNTDLTRNSESGVINGHGTHVAGIIAAGDDDAGITGAAYNCSLLDVKVAENDGSTNAEKVAQGILWAVNHGAKVINVSITINKSYPLLEYAANYAWTHDCLIVAAAGNNFSTTPVYPAAYPNVVSVAATDRNDTLAKWSNHGDWITIAAPGVDIYSTMPGNAYASKNGSSYSAALVSGEAALLYARAIDLNNNGRVNDEVYNTIVKQSDGIALTDGPVNRINIFKATLSTAVKSEMLK